MKKNSLKKAFAAMALTAVAATAATSAFSASAVEAKPVLKLSQIELKWEDLDTDGDGKIDANKTQTIELSVSGAQNLWQACGLHMVNDDRLALVKSATGALSWKKGNAIAAMDMSKVALNGNTVFFTAASGALDAKFEDGTAMWAGEDGVILTYDVTIPDDAQPGDTFPIKFNYVVTPALF